MAAKKKEPHSVTPKAALDMLRRVPEYGNYRSRESDRQSELDKAQQKERDALLRGPHGAAYRLAKRRAGAFRSKIDRFQKQMQREANDLRMSIRLNGVTPRNLRRLKKLLGIQFKI